MSMNFICTRKTWGFDLISKYKSIVENIGVEPMTSCVQGKRSSQLS